MRVRKQPGEDVVIRPRRFDLGNNVFMDVQIRGDAEESTVAALHAIGRAAARGIHRPLDDPLATIEAAIERGDRAVHANDSLSNREIFDEARSALIIVEETIETVKEALSKQHPHDPEVKRAQEALLKLPETVQAAIHPEPESDATEG
jgi:hypothetical protein